MSRSKNARFNSPCRSRCIGISRQCRRTIHRPLSLQQTPLCASRFHPQWLIATWLKGEFDSSIRFAPRISLPQAVGKPSTSSAHLPRQKTLTPQCPSARVAEPTSPPHTDTQTELGKTYAYSVRSVAQHPGVQLESADSNFATITPKDIFPPSAPQDLVVVFVAALTGAPR